MATTTPRASTSSNSPSAPEAQATERTVIDPVTHLSLAIHDLTSGEIPKESSQDEATIPDATPNFVAAEMRALLDDEIHNSYWRYPELEHQYRKRTALVVAMAAGTGGAASLLLTSLFRAFASRNEILTLAFGGAGCCALALVAGAAVLQSKVKPPIPPTEEDRPSTHLNASHQSPETAAWLNSFLASLWPIINPVIFTSVSDMLEDALQASLPKFIHGVRVADIGQGSEPLRILAIRHLKDGAAGKECEGMKPEEGDFVNLELAAAYRAQEVGKNLKGRSRNIHLLVEFYLSGGVTVPVWVEITGIIATTRLRLQLTPNPPFLAAMTLTFLGQPKVTLECTPLSKNFLNVMDVPGLSKWLQTAIDGAIEAYVAPRSLNLDLKTILSGKEKMDTDAVGVIIVTVRSAEGFKNGDASRLWTGKDKRSGDPYVSVGWGKWGKAMWSTRIIENDSQPVWEETAFVLVTSAETNARERLKLQLWDSDRLTADDLLGSVEVPLDEIMSSPDMQNKMTSRRDTLGKGFPGTLDWSLGYMTKTTLEHHLSDAGDLVADLKEAGQIKVDESKSKPAAIGGIDRQKDEALKELTDEIISRTTPSTNWRSGILSVRVEQITGLETPRTRDNAAQGGGEEEESSDLPSAYCTIIINNERVYQTRTKMKSNKPYFNAGTERFVKNWMDATVIIAVRDLRQHESNPLIGVVLLPLKTLLHDRAQVTDSLPLVGGIGFGKLRFSLLWRSVQVQLPRPLSGWDACTLEIQPHAEVNFEMPPDLGTAKLRLELGQTRGQKAKMYPNKDGGWTSKGDRTLGLAMKNRFADCLVLKFRKHAFGPDVTVAWGVFWLRDLPDKEDCNIEISVQKRSEDELDRARRNVLKEANVIGKLKLQVKVWPGLSGYHKKLAQGDPSISDVIQAMDCAEQSLKEDGQESVEYDSDSSLSSQSSSSSSSSSERTSDGRLDAIKDQIKRKDELNRKHRGLMQWSGIRKLEWIGKNVEGKKDEIGRKVKGKLHHQPMEREVENEV